MINFLFTILILFILQSCAPLIGVAGMASLGAASKEKGIGTSLNDVLIHTKISNKIFKFNPDIIADTRIFVNNGSVLITGKVTIPDYKIELTKIAWKIKGVKEVNNETQVSDVSSIKNIARDIASIGEIRARIMTDKRINSLNFSIDVINDRAYIVGIAESKEEMKLVKDQASSARFVKEVFNYIIVTDDKR
jgi:osmotically-inducible protein OsmY